MKKVAVVGRSGLLGGDLSRFLGEDYEIRGIDRSNYEESRGEEFDVLINANGNSKRFWAIENPYEDFEASTVSVYKTLFDFKASKYIYISSSDVYADYSSPKTTREDGIVDSSKLSAYGFHKYLSEEIVKHNAKDFCILRSSLMLGSTLRKGPFFDILNDNPLFITRDTRLQIITTREVAAIVKAIIGGSISGEIFNMGGRGTFSFQDIGKYFDREITISHEAKKQEYEMNVEKLHAVHQLKTSEEYLQEFVSEYNKAR